MNVLLLSMPDAFEHMPTVAIRMPNGALASLAGNVDAHHRVDAADLVLAAAHVRETVRDLAQPLQPGRRRPVGDDVPAADRAQDRGPRPPLRPAARIVAGGYDPSLAPDAYDAPDSPVDFVVRGEGELTLRELLRALERGGGLEHIPGLTWRDGDAWRDNPARHVVASLDDDVRLPDRGARVLDGYTMLGRPVDVVETSRGCTFDCSFCSIIEMRGRNFHPFTIERVIADIARRARPAARGAIFLVDDNITLDVQRFEALCQRHRRRPATTTSATSCRR